MNSRGGGRRGTARCYSARRAGTGAWRGHAGGAIVRTGWEARGRAREGNSPMENAPTGAPAGLGTPSPHCPLESPAPAVNSLPTFIETRWNLCLK
jgi:hypothetical protein